MAKINSLKIEISVSELIGDNDSPQNILDLGAIAQLEEVVSALASNDGKRPVLIEINVV